VAFSIPLEHLQVGNGWATWSNGYTGDVYWNQGAGDITLTLPAGTKAFYAYAEPDAFGVETISATASNSKTVTVTQDTNGSGGATGFGFWATGPDNIATVTFHDATSSDFAVGQFGISNTAVPEPSSVMLLGAGLIVTAGYAIRRKRAARRQA
jgi:hypothetical protein